MDDRAHVEQKPIRLQVANLGKITESTIGFSVSFPLDGCESRQLMDLGSLTAIMASQHIPMAETLRAIVAYAAIWDIPLVKQSRADFARSNEAEKTQTG